MTAERSPREQSPGVFLGDGEPPVTEQSASPATVPAQTSALSDTVGDTEADTGSPVTESNATVLDAVGSERQFYRDSLTGTLREIWRPGDRDGNPNTDYYDRPGPTPPLEQRWRLYQLQTGNGPVNATTNMPPKYVILDDRAAYEVSVSTMKHAQMVRFWPHDFGGAGKIRARRPHRGRPAITDPNREDDGRYFYTEIGIRKDKYYFTGEKDYKPVVYRGVQQSGKAEPSKTPAEKPKKRQAASPLPGEPRDLRKHGHNQYTPRDQLVKYGAPSQAKGRSRYRPRINAFLRRDPSPNWSKNRSKLYGGIAENARSHTASVASRAVSSVAPRTQQEDPEESLWVEQDAGTREDDIGTGDKGGNEGDQQAATIDEPTATPSDDASGSDMEFPLARAGARAANAGTTIVGVEISRGRKVVRRMGYIERMAAEQDATLNAQNKFGSDTGSYAARVEAELSQAKVRIEEQEEEIIYLYKELDKANSSNRELQEKLAAVTAGLAGAQKDVDY